MYNLLQYKILHISFNKKGKFNEVENGTHGVNNRAVISLIVGKYFPYSPFYKEVEEREVHV